MFTDSAQTNENRQLQSKNYPAKISFEVQDASLATTIAPITVLHALHFAFGTARLVASASKCSHTRSRGRPVDILDKSFKTDETYKTAIQQIKAK